MNDLLYGRRHQPVDKVAMCAIALLNWLYKLCHFCAIEFAGFASSFNTQVKLISSIVGEKKVVNNR